MQTIPEIVTEYRNPDGLPPRTLREMGEALGVSYETIRGWEDGRHEPSTEWMLRSLAMVADGWPRLMIVEMWGVKHPDSPLPEFGA